MDVSEHAIYRHTSDIPSINRQEPAIRGKKLELLTQLMNDGYIQASPKTRKHLRKLRTLLPVIQYTQVNGKSMYYMDGKNKLALQSLMKTKRSRIISYQELKTISKAFGVDLDPVEKQKLVRLKREQSHPVIRKNEGGYHSSNTRSQTRLDDFKGRNPFVGKKSLPKNRKLQDTISDILREIEDLLEEFYIPSIFSIRWFLNREKILRYLIK